MHHYLKKVQAVSSFRGIVGSILTCMSVLFFMAATAFAHIPTPGYWAGTTNRNQPMSFTVSRDSTQWSSFKLKTDFSGGGVSGSVEITLSGHGPISAGYFSFSGSTFSFTGNFTSSRLTNGTYSFTNFPIFVYPGYYYLTQYGTWSASSNAPLRPSPRDKHAMTYDPVQKKVVLFGGYSSDDASNVKDTWVWDGKKWAKASSAGPSARAGAAMAYDPILNKSVLFGGSHDEQALNDTWTWDGIKWKIVSKTGPLPRFEHAMAYFGKHKKILLFGGYNNGDYSDTWEWTGTKWTQIGLDLIGRRKAAMAYDKKRSRMVLFGGNSGASFLGDTWEFDGKAWKKVCETGPKARSGAAMAYDENLQKVVLFGGYTESGLDLADVVNYRDTWAWDGKAWKKLSASGPSARSGHAMASDTLRKRVILFGGGQDEQTKFNDTWEWDGKTWKQVNLK